MVVCSLQHAPCADYMLCAASGVWNTYVHNKNKDRKKNVKQDGHTLFPRGSDSRVQLLSIVTINMLRMTNDQRYIVRVYTTRTTHRTRMHRNTAEGRERWWKPMTDRGLQQSKQPEQYTTDLRRGLQ